MKKLFYVLIMSYLLAGAAPAQTPSLGFYKRGDWVSFASRPVVKGTKFTITAWIRFADGADGIALGNADGNDIRIEEGKIQSIVYNTAGESVGTNTTAEYSDSAWHFVAVVRDDLFVRLYVDNVLQGTAYFMNNKPGAYEISALGRRGIASDSNYFKGAINGVRLYNIPLSKAQLSELYNNGQFRVGVPTAGLVGGWDLTEGAGNTVADFSGNGNAGALQGATTIGARWIANRNRTAAQNWYVSSTGSVANTGATISQSWDIHTALSHPPPLLPGDTIILLDNSTFPVATTIESHLTGSAARRITVRAQSPIGHFPNKVKLDANSLTTRAGQVLSIRGAYTDYCDLEIYKSAPQRTSREAGSAPLDIMPNGGIKVWGKEIKLLYPHVHDVNAEGISIFDSKGSVEIVFPLLYNNGWTGPDSTHASGLYTHNNNRAATITWRNVVAFNNYYGGIQHYTSTRQYDSYNQRFLGVHTANNGINIAGSSPKHGFEMKQFNVYKGGVAMGYGDEDNYDIVADDIYAYADSPPISFKAWRNATLSNSVSITSNPGLTGGMMRFNKIGGTVGNFKFFNNKYYAGLDPNLNQTFAILAQNGAVESDTSKTFAQWQALGFDVNSKFYYGAGNLKPTANVIRYYADDVTVGRGLIVVWNWQNSPSVAINLSNFNLTDGRGYKIYNAMNPAAPPLLAGNYSAASPNVSLSMISNGVAKRIGDAATTPADTLPAYGMFLVVPSASAATSTATVR